MLTSKGVYKLRNHYYIRTRSYESTFLNLLFFLSTSLFSQLAFPGATGFGKSTRGAYAKFAATGKTADLPVILFVDNLNDDGRGSLRAALRANMPRIVIFRVGGIITLSKSIVIKSPYITIAGYTAPGDGICVRGNSANANIRISASEVIIRNIRFRNGKYAAPDGGYDNIGISAGSDKALTNIIIDHCSASWASDEQISINGGTVGVSNVTIQNCILAEGFAGHSMGSLFIRSNNISVHHNLYVNNEGRNPKYSDMVNGTVINNLVHNWASQASEYGNGASGDIMYNKFKPGGRTTKKGANRAIQLRWDGEGYEKVTVHIYGNEGTGKVVDIKDEGAGDKLSPTPIYKNSIYGFTPETNLANLEKSLLPGIGASPRDVVDTRLVNNYINRSGTEADIPTSTTELKYPIYNNAPYPTNNNGVHLTWLVNRGYAATKTQAAALKLSYLLNPANGRIGYSIIEEFINDPVLPNKALSMAPAVSLNIRFLLLLFFMHRQPLL